MRPKKLHKPKCVDRLRPKKTLRTYDDVVDHYIATCRTSANAAMRWFASRPNLQDVVKQAALGRTPDDKRHPHQYRIPETALRAARARLARYDLTACKSFDELHERIADLIGGIPKIGELVIYDIASRIGAFLKRAPEKIYLHRGTRIGARNIGLKGRRRTLDIDELPKAFGRLKPREIEDCLCIYKDELKTIRMRSPRAR